MKNALGALAVLSGLVSCASEASGPETFAVSFAPLVGNEPFACSKKYTGIGTSKTSFEPLDFRMYVTDVSLLRADGSEVPLTLTADNQWQTGKFALLDFEDGSGTCTGGTKETNLTLRGTAPQGVYTGIAFSLGIPEENNHIDAATARAPLNAPGMWWSWSGGYKYLRLDVATPMNTGYYLHLGATKCEGSVSKGYTCAAGNRPRIVLKNLDLAKGKIELDVASLWADVDLNAQIDGKTDFVPGCMAFPGDPECPTVFSKLGLSMDGTPLQTQSFFKVAQ
jgi:uncharacterized repeat protein (TIGR04052 family)